ncbi:hypothetical protein LINPERHAP1_LOCUS17945, partial [Linum perenne]
VTDLLKKLFQLDACGTRPKIGFSALSYSEGHLDPEFQPPHISRNSHMEYNHWWSEDERNPQPVWDHEPYSQHLPTTELDGLLKS